MSALPLQSVQTIRSPQPPRLEVVSSRSQRRARPKSFYAMVTVGGLIAILLAQLLLSIAVSNGAYQIAGLHKQQSELTRDQQALTEELQVLRSPQHLASSAEVLGMVTNPSTAYLRLSDGAVIGSPVAARASDGIAMGADGQTLVPNELLAGIAPVSATTESNVQSSQTETGSQGPESTIGSGTPDGALPTPNTR